MKTLFTTLGALGIFLWVFGLSMACYTLNNGEGFLFWKRKLIAKGRHAGETRTTWNWPGLRAFLWCVLGSAVPTAAWVLQRGLGETFPWWGALICLVLMLALMVNIGIWWSRKTGVRWYEIIPHYLLIGQYTFIALAMAGIVAAAIASPFWASVVAIVPQLVSTYLGGYLLWSMFFCWSQEAEAKHKTLWKVLGWIIVGLTTLLLTLTLILGLAWPTRSTKVEEQPVETQVEPAPAPVSVPQWYWYHDAVLEDNFDENGNEWNHESEDWKQAILNDYDFGTDLVHEAVMRKLNAGKIGYSDIIACKSEEELVSKGLLLVNDVTAVFYERLSNDPTQLAAAAAWYDVTFHTDFLGEFMVNYEGQEERWMKIINHAAEWWAENPTAFYQAADRFVQELEHCNEIQLRFVSWGITDQMYMDGIIPGEMPRIIVMKSPNQFGWVLDYTKNIKSNRRTAGYCTKCGGQAYNVAETLEVTPQENPTKPGGGTQSGDKSSSGGGKPQATTGGGKPQTTTGGGKPQVTTGGGTPQVTTGGGAPQITDPKDPTKGSDVPHQDVRPNDDPGITGDEFTYDPRDPWHSTAEVPMNSENGMNMPQFDELNGDAKDAEALPRRGDTPDNGSYYTPTYKPTPVEQSEGGVETHSNDDDGGKAGFGGIDVVAPVDTPATGNVVNNSGNVTQQTGSVAETVQQHWGADMSR